jgi:hypothetical protein
VKGENPCGLKKPQKKGSRDEREDEAEESAL